MLSNKRLLIVNVPSSILSHAIKVSHHDGILYFVIWTSISSGNGNGEMWHCGRGLRIPPFQKMFLKLRKKELKQISKEEG